MVQDSKKRKKKVTTRQRKVPKVQVKSTQASKEILVNIFFLFWYIGHEFAILISQFKYFLHPKLG
jgi:fucose permease